ncbi:hypothetical protein K0U27_09515 [archaeon]|nr:hypothetical protein [archaeon]
MNETTQTQINMGDYNKPQEQTRAIGIGKISGEILNIKAFKTNRGKPSPYTPKNAIGEDGLTDYNVIDTVETFDVNGRQVSSFFVTSAIVKQIQRVPNYQSELAAGNVFGPCKVGQKISAKTSANYWCLLFPGEEGY